MMNKVGGGTGGDDANGSMRPLGSFCLVDNGQGSSNGYQALRCSRKTIALPHGCSEPSIVQ